MTSSKYNIHEHAKFPHISQTLKSIIVRVFCPERRSTASSYDLWCFERKVLLHLGFQTGEHFTGAARSHHAVTTPFPYLLHNQCNSFKIHSVSMFPEKLQSNSAGLCHLEGKVHYRHPVSADGKNGTRSPFPSYLQAPAEEEPQLR